MQRHDCEAELAFPGNASKSSFWQHSFKGPSTVVCLVRGYVGRFYLKIRFTSVLVEENGASMEEDRMKLASDDLMLQKLHRFLQRNNVPWPSNVIFKTQACLFAQTINRSHTCQTDGGTVEPWRPVDQQGTWSEVNAFDVMCWRRTVAWSHIPSAVNTS